MGREGVVVGHFKAGCNCVGWGVSAVMLQLNSLSTFADLSILSPTFIVSRENLAALVICHKNIHESRCGQGQVDPCRSVKTLNSPAIPTF